MPEYIPTPNLGPAEALASQANNYIANKPSPWAALLQGIAPYAQQYGKGAITNYQGSSVPATPTTTPAQASSGSFADPVWGALQGW